MKLTPDQRRQRIYDMIGENPEFMRMKAAYDQDKSWFERFTARLPRRLCSRLRAYPGMMFFLHRRMLDAICRNMCFPDETE